MRAAWHVWPVILCAIATVPAVASARSKDRQARLVTATVEAGNAFYRVFVENDPLSGGLGLYTATTGPAHPAGPGINVLYGDGSPGTTFNSIRSFTTGTDYVQRRFTSSGNPVVTLSSFGSVSPIGTTGFRATYTLPGPPTTPDALTIVQDVNVNGTTFADSTVGVTTTVTNNGGDPVAIGIRYLWDFQIDLDDGPTFRQRGPLGPVLVNETEFSLPAFESYRIEDNDESPAPPTYDVFGTVTGPATVAPPPTAPRILQFADWEEAADTAFDYTVDPSNNIADDGEGSNDSAVLYFFGRSAGDAIIIAPGGSATVSASLFASPPERAAAAPVPTLGPTLHGVLGVALAAGGAVLMRRRRQPRA